jgi:uncharacterized protein Usg
MWQHSHLMAANPLILLFFILNINSKRGTIPVKKPSALLEGVSPKMAKLDRQLRGYRLTTALITYHLPDYPRLLQEYIWQELDLAPKFPELNRFLEFWERRLEGRLHSVKVASAAVIQPGRFRSVDSLCQLH